MVTKKSCSFVSGPIATLAIPYPFSLTTRAKKETAKRAAMASLQARHRVAGCGSLQEGFVGQLCGGGDDQTILRFPAQPGASNRSPKPGVDALAPI